VITGAMNPHVSTASLVAHVRRDPRWRAGREVVSLLRPHRKSPQNKKYVNPTNPYQVGQQDKHTQEEGD